MVYTLLQMKGIFKKVSFGKECSTTVVNCSLFLCHYKCDSFNFHLYLLFQCSDNFLLLTLSEWEKCLSDPGRPHVPLNATADDFVEVNMESKHGVILVIP